jgi:hypothetical protein
MNSASTLASIRIPKAQLAQLNDRYTYGEDEAIEQMAPGIRERDALSKSELLKVVEWKSPRRRRLEVEADESMILEATRIAFTARTEQLRIGVLTRIPGVGFPIASVLLHFFHSDPYPIIDFRALWALGIDVPSQYSFPFWQAYVELCRGLARSWDVSMRELDRALWQYSKENQTAAT